MRCLAAAVLLSLLPAQDPKPAPAAPPAVPAAPATPPPNMLPPGIDEAAFAALHDLKAERAPAPLGSMVAIGKAQHYLSLPKQAAAPLPAVLLIHEWYGLNDHIKHWADRLAGEGYAALAVDLYGGKVATNRDEALAAMKAVEPQQALATLQAAFDWLGTEPRVQASRRATLGWCFGGAWSLQFAVQEPKLSACVLYYGRLVDDPAQLAKIQAPVHGVFGTRDQGIPPAAVAAFGKAMQAAGKRCTIVSFDAEHAFANPSGARYDKVHAAAAWQGVRAFLREHLVAKPAAEPKAAGK